MRNVMRSNDQPKTWAFEPTCTYTYRCIYRRLSAFTRRLFGPPSRRKHWHDSYIWLNL